ncbi:MAG TPA: site-specific DNA-methyltransferase [Anaerolineaceae bacterium]|nr:site-specific DNA-methyltransferase [Anaerolineaceae bacterium]
MPKKPSSPTPISHTRHADKRTNIPTEELRGFVADEERAPRTVLYPRDPSLDPQLVWKGKDAQDQQDLEVPAVPIYIQEKISPQAIIENVRAAARQGQAEQQLTLFADFNNITFEDLVDFYHHEQNWTNRMILGDSLLVMTSLAEKEGLKGRVQMIYMDPPYGIKFGSNWQVSTRKRDVKDGRLDDATRQPEQIKAFRDTWELGIHSYLAYLRDRLIAARELLAESGSVFVQIGDENIHLVRCLMDEVFGSENFISIITFATTSAQTADDISSITDYIIWYAKDKTTLKVRQLLVERSEAILSNQFDYLELAPGLLEKFSHFEEDENVAEFRRVKLDSLTSQHISSTRSVPFIFRGKQYLPHADRQWATSIDGMNRLVTANRIYQKGPNIFSIRYADEYSVVPLSNIWGDTIMTGTRKSLGADKKIFVVQTATKVIERCLLMTTDPGDLVLDPTCGSGTTAYVAEQWGRRWITVDTSRVAVALARTRLMAGRYPYYLLADSLEGARKEAEISGQRPEGGLAEGNDDIRRGFVYRRVPHVTIKTIANNEEIDAIHARWQEMLEPLRVRINQAAGQSWEEWQIPREAPQNAPAGLDALLSEWWSLRRQRQQEIDASIARRADTELLYDQPYEENKRIRVSGPFTVESLSPHRVLATDEDRPETEQTGQNISAGSGGFETLIIDNLRAAGVQNTKKGERLKFTYLEPYAGTWIHAVGEYLDASGATRRAAICIGPEHGTVGPDLIKEAAIEAMQGLGHDLLVVLGFAFDPHVSEEAKRYGKLTVLPARINPDLQMGSDMLKKSGAGNLFMVFGEPDIVVKTQPDGRLAVTIHGVDIYDPTTGEIRSSSTDEIACWFIDTDYNGASFFVRHAYFTGADEPYDKLKRALRAEIDEAAWSALYATTSAPFDRPASGKIAVKVINHYGDEVLKVYEV